MRRQPIARIEEAVAFLRSIHIDARRLGPGWSLCGVSEANRQLQLDCMTDRALVDYARYQQAVRAGELRWCIDDVEQAKHVLTELGLKVCEFPASWAVKSPDPEDDYLQQLYSSEQELIQRAREEQRRRAEASRGERREGSGVEVIKEASGWLLSGVDANANYLERACASETELVSCARAYRELPLFDRNRPTSEHMLRVFEPCTYSAEPLGRQANVGAWPSRRGEKDQKEVEP